MSIFLAIFALFIQKEYIDISKKIHWITSSYWCRQIFGKINKHWIQHTDDFTMRNKNYKEDDHGGYATNIGSFGIAGALGRYRIIKVGNESLQTIGLDIGLRNDDSCIDIKVEEGNILETDGSEVSTFTTKILPLADEKRFDILSKNR